MCAESSISDQAPLDLTIDHDQDAALTEQELKNSALWWTNGVKAAPFPNDLSIICNQMHFCHFCSTILCQHIHRSIIFGSSLCSAKIWIKNNWGCPRVSGTGMAATGPLGPVGRGMGTLWIRIASHRFHQVPSDWYLGNLEIKWTPRKLLLCSLRAPWNNLLRSLLLTLP